MNDAHHHDIEQKRNSLALYPHCLSQHRDASNRVLEWGGEASVENSQNWLGVCFGSNFGGHVIPGDGT
eukprot:3937259-Rhodomonas_salina.2